MADAPQIRRVARVQGASIVLRDVQESDAEFILSLRLDPGRNRYLSPVSDDVEAQRAWIRRYRAGSGEAYFVICALPVTAGSAGAQAALEPAAATETAVASAIRAQDLQPLGAVRLYDARGDSFSWGSWVLRPGLPPTVALESALLVYRLGLSWGFAASHFKVHRANTSVLRFHQSFGATQVGEADDEVLLRLDRAQIERALARYARFLPAAD